MSAGDDERIRRGRGFPIAEAERLLREGVYLPDYPIDLITEAWRRNYERERAEVERLRHVLRVQDDPTLSAEYKRSVRHDALGYG